MPEVELGNVLVTGGASGLGRAIAEAVAKTGGTAIVLDIAEPPSALEWRQVDLADARATERVVAEVIADHGGLDAVVTAAGVDACGDLRDVPAADWERVIAVNLIGTAAIVRAALASLTERRGRVVTVASTLGIRALPAATAYSASKFGVVGFTRALAAELAGTVGVTLLLPGGMRTAFFDDRPDQFKPAPDQLLNRPEDVAEAVLFALRQPQGCEVRELLITPSTEPSWP